jgi:hypothetical protein
MYKQLANKFVADQLARLNSKIRPGLSEDEFRRLFAKCRCGLIMTQHVFRVHNCAPVVPVVIDLTADNRDSTASVPIVIDLTGDSDSDEQ